MEGDGLIDANAQLKLEWDIRRHTTVVSGARRLQSGIIRTPDPDDPSKYAEFVTRSMIRLDLGVRDTPYDAYGALLEGFRQDLRPAAAILPLRCLRGSLLPHLDEIANVDNFLAWESPTDSQYATTCYGDSPINGMLAAAHMTANATDMADEDRTGQHKSTRGPSAFTLVLRQRLQ